ncbi:hypothetical protein O181_051726 [Austropuccinia psidii MF-1]|uniref:Uncharacterized protein n=1 Tax=Austropuccinia psidii MF-1 TaxID=1389203 RepID=A0A9Q3DWZ9_9BASI|nr:hypothetical protein [Austropuccinia psidii MF-1]
MNWLLHPRLILSNPYHDYTPTPPSRCDSNTSPPMLALITPSASTPHMLPRHPQDIPPTPPSTLLTPHPYTLSVPSGHASNIASPSPPSSLLTLPHPRCSQGSLKIYLLCLLQLASSLRSCSFLPTCLQRCSHSSLILKATYHPYAPETLSR